MKHYFNLRSTEIQVNGIGITDKEIKSLFDTVSNLLPSARDMSLSNTTVAAIKFRRKFMVKNDYRFNLCIKPICSQLSKK